MLRYRRSEDEIVTEYSGVGFSSGCFCYSTHGHRTKVIRRSRVRRAEVTYGVQAQHKVHMIVMGAVLVGTLAWPILRVLQVLQAGGELYVYDFLVGALSLLGGWLIHDAVKKGWVLRLELEHGAVKLAFDKEADAEGLREFARQASTETGLRIEMP